jgi:hypothetical protein
MRIWIKTRNARERGQVDEYPDLFSHSRAEKTWIKLIPEFSGDRVIRTGIIMDRAEEHCLFKYNGPPFDVKTYDEI